MRLSSLLPKEGITSLYDPETVLVCGVCDHTKDLRDGMLFIAKRGSSVFAGDLLDEIEEKRAGALLLDQACPLPRKTEIPCFYTQDLATAEAKVWERFYGDPAKELRLFAVTGTNGKTSTALILTHLFEASAVPCGYIGTLGVYFGEKMLIGAEGSLTTPPPALLYRYLSELAALGARCVVLEMSSHALAQRRALLLHFEASIFTNLTEDHLDYHKTMEEYYKAKARLFEQSKAAIINVDDDYGERLFSALHTPKHSVALDKTADYTPCDLHENGFSYTHYRCCAPFGDFSVSYPLFGRFNVYNTLLAVATAATAGLCPLEIKTALSSLKRPKGRLELLPLKKPFSVVIDYAHTPDAMKNAISAVRAVTKGRLLVLFGAGGDREREKRPEMAKIASLLADKVFLTGDNPRKEAPEQIFADLISGIPEHKSYTVIEDRKTAIRAALSELNAEDTLLLLGKGHEEYLAVNGTYLPFSERDIVYEFFKEKKGV